MHFHPWGAHALHVMHMGQKFSLLQLKELIKETEEKLLREKKERGTRTAEYKKLLKEKRDLESKYETAHLSHIVNQRTSIFNLFESRLSLVSKVLREGSVKRRVERFIEVYESNKALNAIFLGN